MLISNISKTNKQDLAKILPQDVQDIDLTKTLNPYSEKQHLLSVADQVTKYFAKRQKFPHTAHEMKMANNWKEVGIRPQGLEYQSIDEKIRSGHQFDTYGWIPNDMIFTNILHNRGDRMNFSNIQTHLNVRKGLFWQALNITVVVYFDPLGTYKFVTVIGNHCTAKSIMVSGLGSHVFARIVSIGKSASLKDIAKFGAIIHHTDSDRRTNQGAEDRLVSGAHAGEPVYEDTMRVLVDLGFDIKNQVKQNGQKLMTVSSPQSLITCIKEFGYDIVKDNCELIRESYPNDTKVLTGALSVLSAIRYYFTKKLNKISKQEFETFFKHWVMLHEQGEIFPNTGKNKDLMIPVWSMIKNINSWAKNNLKRSNKIITKKDMFKVIPEDDLEHVHFA